MDLDKNKITVVTHSGRFHPDDVFAMATLCLALKTDFSIIRTRDEALMQKGDYIVDVGTIYDEANNRFDHHQEGGAGKRPNGIPYASFGLVWKKFGQQVSGSREVADMIEKKLVQQTDADDNGVSLIQPVQKEVPPYTLSDLIFSFAPNWDEPDVKMDDRFKEAVQIATSVLEREIRRAQSKHKGNQHVQEAYEKAEDKRILVLDEKYSWRDVVLQYAEPLFIVSPDKENNTWHVGAVNDKFSFKARKDLPAEWAGKRDAELAQVTGVADAVFCHNARFLAVAKSKESAVKLAQLAVNA